MGKRRASRAARERRAARTSLATARVREREALAAPVPPRTWGAAAFDALPGFLAAVLCALTWIDPRFPGIDMLRIAAPMFFLELPLAIVFAFSDAWRVPGEYLDVRSKLRLILWPTLLVGLPCWALFGAWGLFAVLWLGAGAIWSLWRHGEDRTVTGRWLVIRHREGQDDHWVVRTRPRKQDLPGAWIVPLAHNQYLPAATIVAWIGLAIVLFTGIDIPPGGALPAYAASVGWNDTPVGSVIPAHEALAAGVFLFLVRTFGFFDDVGDDVAPASIEEDAGLKEIVEAVEKKRTRG